MKYQAAYLKDFNTKEYLEPVEGQYGAYYKGVGLKINGETYKGIVNPDVFEYLKDHQQGGELDISLFEEDFNGKTYKKFKVTKKTTGSRLSPVSIPQDLRGIYDRLNALEDKVFGGGAGTAKPLETLADSVFPAKKNEIKASDLPF